MSVTLLALYRRPEGGDDALATFRRRYRDEHLPLIRQVPGLRSLHVASVDQRVAGDEDLVLVTRMVFDDRASLDAGLASEEMRVASRNLREVAPGLLSLFVAGPDPDMGASAAELPADEAGPERA